MSGETATAGDPLTEPRDGLRDDAALWAALAAPSETATFLAAWLALFCRSVEACEAGLLLLAKADGTFAPAAIWPDLARDVTALGAAAHQALTDRRGVVRAREGANGVEIAYPIAIEDSIAAVLVIALARHPGTQLSDLLRRMHWSSGWLEAIVRRQAVTAVDSRLARGSAALQSIAALADERDFDAALMALCNELATRFDCDRVSLSLRRPAGLRILATSGAAWVERGTEVIRAIETAMEEAVSQNTTIVLPATSESRIRVAHEGLSRDWRAQAIVTLPLPADGRRLGAITLERRNGPAFDRETVDTLELIAALAGPILALKGEDHRWFSGRLRRMAGQLINKLLGPRHPAAKLAAVLTVIAVAALATVPGEFRIAARALVEGAVQRAAVAPFAGYVSQAPVRAGDIVTAGQLMAQLDDRDLKLEQLKWESERQKILQRQREALARGDRAGLLVAAAQLGQADAEMALVEAKMERTRITAPIDGVVVSGDLTQMLGSPVEHGKALFEIAPLEGYRVVLQVDEGDVAFARTDQVGTLVLTGTGSLSLPVRVTRLTSVATAQDGRNTFRVEAEVTTGGDVLRPGMQGVAKLDVGRAALLWIWTRGTLARIRFALWSWLP